MKKQQLKVTPIKQLQAKAILRANDRTLSDLSDDGNRLLLRHGGYIFKTVTSKEEQKTKPKEIQYNLEGTDKQNFLNLGDADSEEETSSSVAIRRERPGLREAFQRYRDTIANT